MVCEVTPSVQVLVELGQEDAFVAALGILAGGNVDALLRSRLAAVRYRFGADAALQVGYDRPPLPTEGYDRLALYGRNPAYPPEAYYDYPTDSYPAGGPDEYPPEAGYYPSRGGASLDRSGAFDGLNHREYL